MGSLPPITLTILYRNRYGNGLVSSSYNGATALSITTLEVMTLTVKTLKDHSDVRSM
jgi:hypothetical protein